MVTRQERAQLSLLSEIARSLAELTRSADRKATELGRMDGALDNIDSRLRSWERER